MTRFALVLLTVGLASTSPGWGQPSVQWMPIGEELPGLAWPMTMHGDTVFVASEDGSVIYHSTDHGATWDERPTQGLTNLDWGWITTADGVHLATMYGPPGYDYGILRSMDGGRSWQGAAIDGEDPRTNFIHNLFETGDGALLAGLYIDTSLPVLGETLRSSDAGQSWRPVPIPSSMGPTRQFTQAPDGTLYSAHSSGIEGGNAGVLRSLDGGLTWDRVFDGFPSGPPDVLSVGALANGIVFAVGFSFLYRSTDGLDWEAVPEAPESIRDLYVVGPLVIGYRWGLDQGPPHLSRDGGQTWEAIGNGLTGSGLTEIEADAEGYLYALVDGRLFRSTTQLPVAAEPVDAVPEAVRLDVPRPNPARSSTRLSFSLRQPLAVDLAVFDLLGRRVASVAQGAYGAGTHTFTWPTASLPGGTYIVWLQADGQRLSQRLVVVR